MSTRTSKEKTRIDIGEIQKLIRMIERSPINEFELVESDLKIRISKNGLSSQLIPAGMQLPAVPLGYSAPAPLAAMQSLPTASPVTAASVQSAPTANIVEVKAPMVGTFYRAPSPDADPYVRVGDIVEIGKVMCIIEAMKLMNEIEAEFKGKIVDVLVENAQPVEFGQVMFRIERIG